MIAVVCLVLAVMAGYGFRGVVDGDREYHLKVQLDQRDQIIRALEDRHPACTRWVDVLDSDGMPDVARCTPADRCLTCRQN